MDELIRISRLRQIAAFIDDYYRRPEVHAVALGVFWDFWWLHFLQFGCSPNVNSILSGGSVPRGWDEWCRALGFRQPLSPVYIILYVERDADGFSRQWQPPRVPPPNYAVLVREGGPFKAYSDRARHRPALE